MNSDRPHRPSPSALCSDVTTSAEKVENVVRPPQKPVMIKSRHSVGKGNYEHGTPRHLEQGSRLLDGTIVEPLSRYFTTRTGQEASCMIRSARLPINLSYKPE